MAKPIAKFRSGCVVASVWRNTRKFDDREVEVASVSLERRYKDKNGEWQSTNSFPVNDLPRAQLVLRKAFEHIELRGEGSSDEVGEPLRGSSVPVEEGG